MLGALRKRTRLRSTIIARAARLVGKSLTIRCRVNLYAIGTAFEIRSRVEAADKRNGEADARERESGRVREESLRLVGGNLGCNSGGAQCRVVVFHVVPPFFWDTHVLTCRDSNKRSASNGTPCPIRPPSLPFIETTPR